MTDHVLMYERGAVWHRCPRRHLASDNKFYRTREKWPRYDAPPLRNQDIRYHNWLIWYHNVMQERKPRRRRDVLETRI